MSKNTRIFTGIAAGMLTMCICVSGYIAVQIPKLVIQEVMFKDGPEEIAAVVKNTIDYKLPSGYKENSAYDAGFMQIIEITDSVNEDTDNTRPSIMVASILSGLDFDKENFRLRMQKSMKNTGGIQDYEMKLTDKQEITVRGQQVSLFIYTGTNENSVLVKQAVSSLFEGKSSLVMFGITGEEANWNQEEIDLFIKSIK